MSSLTVAPHLATGTRADAPEVSIVVPVFDEAGNVPVLAAEIHAALARLPSYEVVFVDDGSRDGTRDEIRAEAARDARVRLVGLDANYGLTAAMEAGLERARGRVLVVMDGDLQSDPRDIPALLAALEGHDAACGYRAHRKAGDGWVKVLSSRIANFVRNRLTGDFVRDSGCTFRAFRRECLARVKLFKGMHRFLPTLLRYEGRSVVEVPVNHRQRRHGVSKYGVWNRVFAASYDLLAVRWMRSRIVRWKVAEELR